MTDPQPLLPPFSQDGLLPPGDYVLTLDDLAESLLVVGPDDAERYSNWDSWRRKLVENLSVLVGQLKKFPDLKRVVAALGRRPFLHYHEVRNVRFSKDGNQLLTRDMGCVFGMSNNGS